MQLKPDLVLGGRPQQSEVSPAVSPLREALESLLEDPHVSADGNI